jgi:hypothetical protein
MPDLTTDNNGRPYVSFTELNSSSDKKVTVKKYDGTTWVTVGSPMFSPEMNGKTSIALDNSDTPYVRGSFGDR